MINTFSSGMNFNDSDKIIGGTLFPGERVGSDHYDGGRSTV